MKRLFYAILAIMITAASTEVKAQSPDLFSAKRDYQLKRDTTVNTDTVRLYANNLESGLKSIEVLVEKISGTVGGKVYIQGSSTEWRYADNIDSLTCSNQAQNFKKVLFTATNYLSYRIYYPTSGTQSCVVYFAVLRRPDDER